MGLSAGCPVEYSAEHQPQALAIGQKLTKDLRIRIRVLKATRLSFTNL